MAIKKVGIYGTGKVALSIGIYLLSRGLEVAYCGRSIDKARRYIADIGALSFGSPRELLAWCDAIGFVVTDGAISEVSEAVSRENPDLAKQKYAFHMSGALSSEAVKGEYLSKFSLHPLRAFAKVEEHIDDTVFALEAYTDAQTPCVSEIDEFAGHFDRVIRLKSKDKTLYHASAVIASNLIVPVIDAAYRVLAMIGIDDETLLWPLIDTAMANMKSLGVKNALTGPVARGDAGTVRRHVEELERQARLESADSDAEMTEAGQILRLYTLLSEAALKLSDASEDRKARIHELLSEIAKGEK